MKKILSVLAIGITLVACNDNTSTNDSHRDSVANGIDSTTVTPMTPADTSRAGDTSSYERMPNKSTDTTHR